MAVGQETPPLLPPSQTYVQTYDMQRSTIVMVCNYSGYQSVGKFAIEDYDWSNSLAAWSAATPMDTNERLLVQSGMARSSPNPPLAWIYRNSVYGYPWYNTVRFILDDPAYAPWFIKFAGPGPWVSPNCDTDYQPPKCTDYFHTQMDTPLPRDGGYGKCAPPACNCGSKPCGVRSRGARARASKTPLTRPSPPTPTPQFYVFNHSSTAIVGNVSFQQWFIDSYVLDSIGMSPDVAGFCKFGAPPPAKAPARAQQHALTPNSQTVFDDFWSPSGNMGDNTNGAIKDMGLTPADLLQLTASYTANMVA